MQLNDCLYWWVSVLIRVQFCALVPTRSRAAVSLGGESRPTVSASHMGGMRCADDLGAGLEQVIGVAGIHLLIMGLALGHCGITEFLASCKLGGVVLTGLHQREEEDEE